MIKVKEWAAFILLGLIWGSSFLWIKIAVREVGPFTLVSLRLLLGLVGLLLIFYLKKYTFPRKPKVLLAYLFMGAVNTAIPFTLISWGETRIDSALASIINGTVPLFTIMIAHFCLRDEKATVSAFAGVVVGLTGVIVLVSRDLTPQGLRGDFWGQIAVIAAAICYSVAAIFSRKYLREQSPIVQSTMVLLIADVLLWLAVPLVEYPISLPGLPMTWFAIIWLGLLGSCVAYLLYFYLINAWGSTRATLVTYLFPVIGLILGIAFLHEKADWRLVAGSALIVVGIGVTNLKPQSKSSPPTAVVE